MKRFGNAVTGQLRGDSVVSAELYPRRFDGNDKRTTQVHSEYLMANLIEIGGYLTSLFL